MTFLYLDKLFNERHVLQKVIEEVLGFEKSVERGISICNIEASSSY